MHQLTVYYFYVKDYLYVEVNRIQLFIEGIATHSRILTRKI